jgi:hypothetical protein
VEGRPVDAKGERNHAGTGRLTRKLVPPPERCDPFGMTTIRWDASHWALFAIAALAAASTSLLAYGALCA